MKAVSIKNPWAYLIALGIKDIENRTWKTRYRGKILIHASAKIVNPEFTIEQTLAISKCISQEQFKPIQSAIIGEAEIVDCVINHPSIWAERSLIRPNIEDYRNEEGGNMDLYSHNLNLWKNSKPIYNWVMENAVLYDKPILDVKGKLSLWEYELH